MKKIDCYRRFLCFIWEANEPIRTADLRITSALLYQLSYVGDRGFMPAFALNIIVCSFHFATGVLLRRIYVASGVMKR